MSCKKNIEIPPPTGTISSSQVFSTDDQATAAVAGIYLKMINTTQVFSNYGMTVFSGMSADELIPFSQTNPQYVQFKNNILLPTNSIVASSFWNFSYSIIYSANATIEGLQNYSGVHDSVRNELTGEAEFIRAFCNFYLVNLFGDIPLVTTINWRNTDLLTRTPQAQVYQAIIADLKDAQSKLAADYSAGAGQRVVPNKWAATALLARVYLYLKDWNNAATQASMVIANSSLYSLTADPNTVFLTNSSEAIWQLQQVNHGITFNATPDGYLLIPRILNSSLYAPTFYLTKTLLSSFEPNDLRKTDWIDSTVYRGTKYFFPYKYKFGPGRAIIGGVDSEYYMVLRLPEQYLIRAESEANGVNGGLSNAINDLNVIRERAKLSDYSGPSNKDSIMKAIMHEDQIEYFSEWGHRWLDLKRWDSATTILSSTKGITVQADALQFPIPVNEISTDPNLKQNPGYN